MSISIREAVNADVAGIRDVFLACYGDEYTYPEFYEEEFLRKLVYSDDTLVLVAVDDADDKVLGSASVILEKGAYTDLVGEFGRLVVHPDARGQGLGTRLMETRIERVRDRLHVGLVELRVTHPFTQRISQRYDFAPVGFMPMVDRFGERRESNAIMVRYFGNALDLRRNNPRILPEAYHLAVVAMQNVGLTPDAIVDEESTPYPRHDDFEVKKLTTDGYASLLRIERGRVRRREVLGALSLHYGVFKIRATESNYLIAYREGRVVGAIGFTHDRFESNLRVFELISLNEQVIRFLFDELEQRYLHEWDVATVEVGVSAYAPRMQRTLLELGFLPVGYIPALSFHRVERIDVIKFFRLVAPLDLGKIELISPTKELAELVLRGFVRRQVLPELREAVDSIGPFRGLSEEQTQRVASACGYVEFAAGTTVFSAGDPADEMYLLLGGEVDVTWPDGRRVGTVVAGECLGEVALMSESEHSADARVRRKMKAGVLDRADLEALVRQRPDIAAVLFRNVARDVGDKLKRIDGRTSDDH